VQLCSRDTEQGRNLKPYIVILHTSRELAIQRRLSYTLPYNQSYSSAVHMQLTQLLYFPTLARGRQARGKQRSVTCTAVGTSRRYASPQQIIHEVHNIKTYLTLQEVPTESINNMSDISLRNTRNRKNIHCRSLAVSLPENFSDFICKILQSSAFVVRK